MPIALDDHSGNRLLVLECGLIGTNNYDFSGFKVAEVRSHTITR